MKMLKAAAALAAAALLSGACGANPAHRASVPAAGPGPLPAAGQSGLCGELPPGTVITVAFYMGQNSTSSALRVTGAALAGTRNVTVDGACSDSVAPGESLIGDWDGYPPPGWRHPVALTVPAGYSLEVIFTLTAGSDALVSGERVSYSWRGRSYSVTGQRFLGIPPGMHC
jgi:hypothetical protein